MKMMVLAGRTVPTALWLAMIAVASGEQAAEEKIALRVLTLGNRAPFTQEVRDGVRHEVDPPEGSLPPREVTLGIASPADAATEPGAEQLNLRLGEVSTALSMPRPDPPVVTLRDRETNRIWLKQGLAAAQSTLLIVWRSGKTWDQTRCLALDDSPEAVPHGSCRVVNVAAVEVKLIWGTQRYRLLPGRNLVLRFPEASKDVPLEILYPDAAGTLRPCLSTTAEADPANRRQWFVFRADRADARTPVQVLPLSEAR